ncbi:angiotensin-converting enzyme [Anabrus simplex]|uniref:angiotensin-converting enzyme n=1 Tax=Anabrus simplex TaxID=316456 RepID=UPI0035A2908E
MRVLWLTVLLLAVAAEDEEQLTRYLQDTYEPEVTRQCNLLNEAEWNYETDVSNEEKQAKLSEATLEYARFEKEQWEKHFRGVNYRNFKNETVKRQLEYLTILGLPALSDDKLSLLNNCTTSMSSIYATGKVCPYNNQKCNLSSSEALDLDPGLQSVLYSSRDYDELVYIWEEWRKATGAKMREDYKTYVMLNNEAARLNNFSDMGEMWRHDYSSPSLEQDVLRLWSEVEPLYAELHEYTRRRLKKVYGDKIDVSDGLLPAHILGNMWAQSWSNILDILKPYENATSVNVTDSLTKQGYNPYRMFVKADEFYKSLGLIDNSVSYGEKAMLERPTDGREVVCHASAWDFCIKTDFRIKMCTNVKMEDFIIIHHEMGHIQYYQQYKDQPYVFRKGANPAFHEAIGDTIALSVSTPKHLERVNLLADYTDTAENSINALMSIALEKVAFLPFGLLIDMWRWDVFSGKVPEDQWNAHWWSLRQKFQRVKPPSPRSESDFDPGAKYHVPGDSQYIAYFLAHILQFQLHKALCIAAEEYDPANPNRKPLHTCDIYNSTKAGSLLAEGLKLGGSQHWKVALKAITGEEDYNGSALVEYFKPLHDYLKAENIRARSEDVSQVIPVAVGCILALLVVGVLIAYVLYRRRLSRGL